MRSFVIAGLALALSAAAAHAADEECTEELVDARRTEISTIVRDDPTKTEKLADYLKEAEKNFRGMQSDEDICDGLGWILEQLAAGE